MKTKKFKDYLKKRLDKDAITEIEQQAKLEYMAPRHPPRKRGIQSSFDLT